MNGASPHYIASPCVRRCTLDDTDICVGCGRHLDEIKEWSLASAERQQDIIQRAQKRLTNRMSNESRNSGG